MIVVGIMGTLSAIAIPSYNTYVAKAQLSEAFVLIGAAQIEILEVYNETGNWGVSTGFLSDAFGYNGLNGSVYTNQALGTTGLLLNGSYVSGLTIISLGEIGTGNLYTSPSGQITFVPMHSLQATISAAASPLIAGAVINFSYNFPGNTGQDYPNTGPDGTWTCSSSLPQNLIPKTCQSDVMTAPEPNSAMLLYFGFIGFVLAF